MRKATKRRKRLFSKKESDELLYALKVREEMEKAEEEANPKVLNLLKSYAVKYKDLGLRKGLCELPDSYRQQVLLKLSKIKVAKGHIPALPVITSLLKSFDDLMDLFSSEEIKGINDLNSLMIENVTGIRNLFYFIYNVDLGKRLNNRSPIRAEDLIYSSGRKPLTVEEAISLCIHDNHLLDEYKVVALGSEYRVGEGSEVPVIKKLDDKVVLSSVKRTEQLRGCMYPSKM